MDEGSENSNDKRNWRERLGIGKQGAGNDLPKIADEFKAGSSVVKPAPVRPSASKPAPMAPRVAPKPIAVAPRPSAAVPRPAPVAAAPAPVAPARPAAPQPRTPPVAADALAAKLKEQRDAAEKLAIQRVAAAKQKTEAVVPGKPKFTFADAEGPSAARPAVAVTAPPPVLKPTIMPQPQPVGYGQVPVAPAAPVGFAPGFQQPFPGYQPNPVQPPPQAYRPVEAGPRYAQPSAFQARPAAPVQGPAGRSPQPGMRAPAPFQPANGGFQPRAAVPPGQPRMPQMPMASQVAHQAGPRLSPAAPEDVFEDVPMRGASRRATANEYQQAYRDELSDAFEPEKRGSALGWILTGIVALMALAFGGWYYLQMGKPGKVAGTTTPPAIEAPTTPVRVAPEQPAAAAPAAGTAAPVADQVGKKLIYDRIEGDREIPGGPVKSSEQPPGVQPGGGQAAPGTGGAVPLPLPPPPAGNGQQGAIPADGKSDVAVINPAAEQSSAVVSSAALPIPDQPPPPTGATANVAPVAVAAVATAAVSSVPAPVVAAPPQPKPVVAKPVIAPAAAAVVPAPRKRTAPAVVDDEQATDPEQPIEPKVLVAPAQPIAPVARTLNVGTATAAVAPATVKTAAIAANGNGLYGDAAAAPVAAPKVAAQLPVIQAPAPISTQTPSGYQVQLASFASKSDATTEYQRLVAKHGAIISRYAPLIEQAQVAGSTRYRLNLGPMANSDAAQSLCASLIAAGERDCLVRR